VQLIDAWPSRHLAGPPSYDGTSGSFVINFDGAKNFALCSFFNFVCCKSIDQSSSGGIREGRNFAAYSVKLFFRIAMLVVRFGSRVDGALARTF
jgi:hypothetical protein